VALMAIMAEWSRTDLAYADRVDHLLNGGGLSDPYLLNASTVFDDGTVNVLTGGGGMNLFFVNGQGVVTDLQDGEVVVSVASSPSPGAAGTASPSAPGASAAPPRAAPLAAECMASDPTAPAARKGRSQPRAADLVWLDDWQPMPLAELSIR
jgi:hypothetical protein